jgi:putative ABC transport system substrate-binding protein
MKRRAFITLLGGAAVAPMLQPLGTRAQQPAMPVIGFLNSSSSDAIADRLRGFHRGLKEGGYVDGENVTIAYRFADNEIDRFPALAAELVQRRVAVIVSGTAPTVVSTAKAATQRIPIVFLVSDDPVKLGLVASLARPGGNLTGVNFFNAELNAKRLELLRELVPAAVRIAVLLNPTNATTTESALRDVEVAGRVMGLQLRILNASSSPEIDAAFDNMARERPDALYVGGDNFLNSRRLQLALLAARHAIPATYASRDYPEYGGLMSYGTNVADAYRQVGVHVGRILKGAKPEDLPVVQASTFELVINHQTARMLGLTVPPQLLARADEVIE